MRDQQQKGELFRALHQRDRAFLIEEGTFTFADQAVSFPEISAMFDVERVTAA